MRLFVLIERVSPLRVWVNREGIARFCAARYAPPALGAAAGDLEAAGLTNAASYRARVPDMCAEDVDGEDPGPKRALSMVLGALAARGHDVDALWARIDALVARLFLALRRARADRSRAEPTLSRRASPF